MRGVSQDHSGEVKILKLNERKTHGDGNVPYLDLLRRWERLHVFSVSLSELGYALLEGLRSLLAK